MKYRLISLAAIVLIIGAVFAAQDFEPQKVRYHQHLEEPGYTPCNEHGDEKFCSHLPLVMIETGGQTIPGRVQFAEDGSGAIEDSFGESLYSVAEDGQETIRVQVSVIDNPDGNNHLTDGPDFTAASDFRIRGHASRRFEKASYLLKYVDDEGQPTDISVMGMGAHNKWVLHGPCLDKTLIRNYICYNLAGSIMEYAPNVRFCEVFLDGEYQGLYLMTESIDNGKDCRLELKQKEMGITATGYLLRIDRTTDEDLKQIYDIYSYMERMLDIPENIQIQYPGQTTLTPELARDIEQDFAAFEKCIYSYDFNNEDYGYKNWIDVDNFVDYFIINEFTLNNDAGQYSTYIYKDVSGKYKLCVWDFNNAYDNFPDDEMNIHGYCLVDRAIYSMLFRDEEFVSRVIERYQALRKGVLSDESLNTYIDETVAWLGPVIERNRERWETNITTWSPLKPVSRNVYSHTAALMQLKGILSERSAWLDENIQLLRRYSSESRNKAYLHE